MVLTFHKILRLLVYVSIKFGLYLKVIIDIQPLCTKFEIHERSFKAAIKKWKRK